jgi:23S rRNA (pseudouridine1915-N3)-methyltransferase
VKITVVAVGSLKESYFRAAAGEYIKRLSPYSQIRIVEIPEEKPPANPSPADEEKVREKEAERIQKALPAGAFVISLSIKGKPHSSESLAEWFQQLQLTGHSHLCFIIGGSTGLSPKLNPVIDTELSFGPITLPHQLARIILLEQVYRAFKITRNEPYHK